MALSGFLFLSWRLFEILMLIPPVGMLAWFVHGYVDSNQLTPNFILVLFIVCTLALAWAIFTTISYLRARHDALFVAFVDLGFVGALIAGVVVLRGIAPANCSNFSGGEFFLHFGPFGYYGVQTSSKWALHINKNCAMLKACFAFGIINILLFWITFVSSSDDESAQKELKLTFVSSCSLYSSTETTATTIVSSFGANITAPVPITDVLAAETTVAVAITTDRAGEVHKDRAVDEIITYRE